MNRRSLFGFLAAAPFGVVAAVKATATAKPIMHRGGEWTMRQMSSSDIKIIVADPGLSGAQMSKLIQDSARKAIQKAVGDAKRLDLRRSKS